MPVTTWIEEFLYRGRPPEGPGSEMDATYHVIIAQSSESPFGPTEPPVHRVLGPLTSDQAQTMGHPLASLVQGINEAAITEMNIARAERDQARQNEEQANNTAYEAVQSFNAMKVQAETLVSQLELMTADRDAVVTELQATKVQLAAAIALNDGRA